MKKIKLSQNKYATIDNKEFDFLNQFKWHAHKSRNTFYARTIKSGKTIIMHRLIMNANFSEIIDHINGNGLDNQKKNLRLVSLNQNRQNSIKAKSNKSGYKGVSWYKNKSKWRVSMGHNGKFIHIGYFLNKKDAARAYNNAAIKYFGEFAKLNKINLEEK